MFMLISEFYSVFTDSLEKRKKLFSFFIKKCVSQEVNHKQTLFQERSTTINKYK